MPAPLIARCATDTAAGTHRREWSLREPCSSAEGGARASWLPANADRPSGRQRRPVARVMDSSIRHGAAASAAIARLLPSDKSSHETSYSRLFGGPSSIETTICAAVHLGAVVQSSRSAILMDKAVSGSVTPSARDGIGDREVRMLAARKAGAPKSHGRSRRRPAAERFANLPFVAERIDDPPQTPAVLVADGRGLCSPSCYGLRHYLLGILNDE